MKHLCLILALLAIASGASRRPPDVSKVPAAMQVVLRKVLTEENITRAMNRRVCTDFEKVVEMELLKTEVCLYGTNYGNETVCHALRTKVPRCFDAAMEYFEECLKDEWKAMMPFLRGALGSIVGYVCESTGEQMLELGNPCILRATEESNKIYEAFRELISKLEDDNTLPDKVYVCKVLSEVRNYAKLHVESTCGLKITRESVTRLIDAMMTPCPSIIENDS